MDPQFPMTSATASKVSGKSSRLRTWIATGAALLLSSLTVSAQTGEPDFSEVSVHDPSVCKVGDRYYVFGSHVASAYTDDLRNWTQLSYSPTQQSLIPNLSSELSEALAYEGGYQNYWAPDVIQLSDGKYYYFYCVTKASEAAAALGVLSADDPEGPYTHEHIIVKGKGGSSIPDGSALFNARWDPHCIDPTVFYDAEGKLQMVYGSYSGGIFILELDEETVTADPADNYGTHLWGGEHARIEGPYIIYNPETEYYYLFVSYYGLNAADGYNIRVARARDPHGPYLDSEGNDMETVSGAAYSVFDDASIAPYGVKIMGGYQFLSESGEPKTTSTGYLSPGHNSAYYDEETGKCFLFFHTRFVGRGEQHQVRVHQMYFNEDGWPVVAPHRYSGETLRSYSSDIVAGSWKVIHHGPKINTGTAAQSVTMSFDEAGTITSGGSGTWEMVSGHDIRIGLDGVEYRGVVSHQYDTDNDVWVLCFSALSPDGIALWGSQVAVDRTSLETFRLIHFGSTEGVGEGADTADFDRDGVPNLVEYALHRDPTVGSAKKDPVVTMEDGQFIIRFDRILEPDFTYEVITSDDLSTEQSIWSSTGSDNTLESVEVKEPIDPGEAKRKFVRAKVSN